jgi:hypothetical protein
MGAVCGAHPQKTSLVGFWRAAAIFCCIGVPPAAVFGDAPAL